MGKALAKLFGKKDMRILMLGLDAAGKTSILLILLSVCVCVFVIVTVCSCMRERERERERGRGREEEGEGGKKRERVNIPVGMLITLDTVANKSLYPRIHLVCVNQHIVHIRSMLA